jgi:nucleoside-diphosphate-sugar epimerase
VRDILVITGGAGFCGTHLAERLSSQFRVRLFDSFARDSLRFSPYLIDSPDIEIVRGDVLDKQSLRTAVDGARVVVHCAAIAGVSNYYERPIEVLRVNIIGTFNLLDALVDARVERIIQFSTSEIYGPHANSVAESALPTTGLVTDRRWVYSVGKLAAEHATLRYGEVYGIEATTVRPFNIYGPRQTGEGAIANFARNLIRGDPLDVFGDGSEVRAWCHITDLVTAIELMLNNKDAYNKAFNIGNPQARLTTMELAETMIAIYGKGQIRTVPQKHTPVTLRIPDISLAQAVLGFNPRVNIMEGLKDTIKWFEEAMS